MGLADGISVGGKLGVHDGDVGLIDGVTVGDKSDEGLIVGAAVEGMLGE